jgi:hypothetical protein
MERPMYRLATSELSADEAVGVSKPQKKGGGAGQRGYQECYLRCTLRKCNLKGLAPITHVNIILGALDLVI